MRLDAPTLAAAALFPTLASLMGCMTMADGSTGRIEPLSQSTTMISADDIGSFLDPAGEMRLAEGAAAGLERACEGQTVADAATLRMQASSCASADGDACARLGFLQMCGAPGQDEAHLTTLERACALGSDAGCHHFAGALLAGTHGKRDSARALRIWHRACANGSGRACGSIGMSLMLLGRPAATARGVRYLQKACAGGDRQACRVAAEVSSGPRAPAEVPAIAALF